MKNALIHTLLFILFTGCNSSIDKQSLKEDGLKTERTKTKSGLEGERNIPIDYSDSINFRDANGLKQGHWIKKWRGRLVEDYMYVNDTLHGPYELDHGEGYYKNGKKEGFEYLYYGEKESLLGVNYYENGAHIWSGCPTAGRAYVIPVKEFQISKDSTYVKAPYINGQLWYEGSFCLLPDKTNNGLLMPHRYGIHKVYHMNGKIKGIIDNSKETIQEFDSLGNLLYKAKFEQYEIHRQRIGRYVK